MECGVMKICIQSGALNAAAAWAAKIAPNNPHIPITSGVLIAADDDGLRMAATDYDTFGTITLPEALVPDGGRTVVSARLLAAVTKTLRRDDEVLLETGERGLEVCCGRSQWVLPEIDPQDWPSFPDLGEPIGCVASEVLARGLTRVLPAVSTDSKTPWLTGVAFDTSATLMLAATDRYRLAATELEWQPTLNTADQHLIVPADLLHSALAAIDSGEVAIHSDGNTVGLVSARHQITARLVAGQYPAWRSFIDGPANSSDTTATVNVEAFTRAVTQVSAVADHNAKVPELIRLELTEEGIGISLASDGSAQGSGFVKLHNWLGKPVTVGVSHRYLLDSLGCLDSLVAVVNLNGSRKPILLRAADEHGGLLNDGYWHVLMPRQLTEVKVAA
jgi:DNA polymerase III subunit beta